MIRISKKQCAIINAAVNPFRVTTNYLSERLRKVIEYHAKYYSRCRMTVYKYTPVHKNQYHLTLEYNRFRKRGGYARPKRPTIHRFYGVPLQTVYGRKVQAKKLKWARKRLRKRKKKAHLKKQEREKKHADTKSLKMVDLSAGLENAKKTEIIRSNFTNCTQRSLPVERSWTTNNTKNSDTANIFNETIVNDCRSNLSFADALDEHASSSDTFHSMEEDTQTSNVSESTHNTSLMSGTSNDIDSNTNGDINDKLRQQLKLLKARKSDFALISMKDSALSLRPRPATSLWRRSDSNGSTAKLTTTEPLATITKIGTKEAIDQNAQQLKINHAKKQIELNERSKTSKPVSGMIDSLFNKLKSINQSDADSNSTQSRLRPNSMKTTSPTQTATSTPLRRNRRDDSSNKISFLSDSNPEDSNQSTASMSIEFHGFDISNKNVDVSALLPTPKAQTTNSQSAFISEDLDMFLKENSLENVAAISIKPKSFNTDEALMTKDAQPPNLAVPERPMDMQRPRTLAEKRMILQQHNDVSIMIIENESTVYHELRKRVKFGSSYDNGLMQRIQDVNVPFTRDCWRAACWVATSNNRFFYRTIVIDGEEIKLIGSRGDNWQKVSFEVKTKDPRKISVSKYLPPNCSRICLPIENIKITNIDDIIANIKLRNDNNIPSLKCGSIFGEFKNAKLNMFSREYLAPGPKCKKAKCKWNRSTSFDLEYGPLELLYLPTVQLEVWPQIGLALPEHIKPLLKNILPESNVITHEWAKFAVSVVKEPTNKPQQKHRRKYKKPEPEPPQSFVFDIPYENSEKKILIRRRRRSSIVFNKNDAKNEKIESFYLDTKINALTFLNGIDASDRVAVQCADILSNMIESVAVSVNERNFTKSDPDIDYVGKVVTISQLNKENSKTVVKADREKQASKTENAAKMKLMKELKRLNVTVIDTADEATKSKSSEQCTKPFCRLGCVCESIEAKKYIPSHCNRVECIFDCKCIDFKRSNYFGFDRDIDLLHAQANARLAKVEKEFKSTIVVSENDTFVLPNTSTATKRSSKKPKRFTSDESCFDDPETEMFWKSKRRRQERIEIERYKIDEQQRNNLVRSAQHVRVVAEPLPDLDVEPWCMFHCLYKCHCKGKSQKGIAFNFANKKNDIPAHTLGGWEIISPRKRQYTFERELGQNAQAHELSLKLRKNAPDPPIKARKIMEPVPQPTILIETRSDAPVDGSESAARTRAFNCLRVRRKTTQEIKTLRNTCMFDEKRYSNLLKERIQICRNYNKTQNMLIKTMENGLFSKSISTDNVCLSQSGDHTIDTTTSLTPSISSVRQLNDVISDTMQRLTCNQRQDKLVLRRTTNKLSIVGWDRVIEAFKARELFVWDVTLVDNNRTLLMTDSFMKPQNARFVSATNINYIDSDSLPMLAKLLRMHVCNEQTKYLAVMLLRLTDFWRILGVVHSDLKYMENELIARPTPEKNPLLSKKINTLFHLLTNVPKEPIDSQDPIVIDENNEEISQKSESALDKPDSTEKINSQPDLSLIDDSPSKCSDFECTDIVKKVTSATQSHRNINFFENASMRLSLPIPIERTQRLLRMHIGDDFTHMWFPTWRKFLSLKQIQNTLTMAKASGKAIEMSQSVNRPKVFVSHLHDNQVFMGPYESTDVQQNVSLFVRNEERRMELAEDYHKKHGPKYTKKTKVQWVYPHSRLNGENTTVPQITNANLVHFKIDQVFSKHDLPPDFPLLKTTANNPTNKADSHEDLSDTNDVIPSATNESNSSKQFEWTNGSKKRTMSSTSTTSSKSSDTNIACYRTVDNGDAQKEKQFTVPKIRLIKTKLITTGNKEPKEPIDLKDRKQVKEPKETDSKKLKRELELEPLQLKITSVASGDGVALMTNGYSVDPIMMSDNSNDSNSKDTELLIPKTEPIDITDMDTDDDDHYVQEEPIIPMIAPNAMPSKQKESKGYIYCSTNISLGKISIQKTSPTTIQFNLHSPLEIDCEDTTWQKNMPSISSFMQSYIRKRFYAVYPAYLRLDWVFINDERDPYELNDFIELDDFNKLHRFSVIFKDKIIELGSNYIEDQSLSATEIYVLDIFKLASQLLKDEEVKLLNISDILKKARHIDQQLTARMNKLNRSKLFFEKEIEKMSKILNRDKQNSIQNGEDARSNSEQSVVFNREQL